MVAWASLTNTRLLYAEQLAHCRQQQPSAVSDTFWRLQATDLFDTILETQPRGGGGGGKSREDIVTEMCVDLLSKVHFYLSHFVAKN